ncbi:MAG: preprotein translocase subunit SecY [Ruminococcus sp.]|nr:preprotein translocase subunit SecY [Ruminococcus sp.]
MIESFRNAWKVPELRKKLLFTFFIIVIYRIGGTVPVPYLDSAALSQWFSNNNNGNVFSYLNVLSGGNFAKATVMALSVGPYINAQIIIQLLTYALPPLERLSKEGPEGRKTLNKITKYSALAISLFQGWAYYRTMFNAGAVIFNGTTMGSKFDKIFAEIIIILVFTAGSSLTIWLGDQINEKGIGNGISMLLFAGIIARGPSAVFMLFDLMKTGEARNMILVPIIIIVFVLMIAFIIFMNEAERRIPIQYAKRVVGRKQYGGQNTYIPIKIAMSGVLPIIFAMSFMAIPSTIELFVTPKKGGVFEKILEWFNYDHPVYACLYFLLIIGFNYFYVSMSYNPLEIANNLRQNNGGIPGIRPGKPTTEYLKRVLSKITLVGAIFLGVIAIFPIIFSAITKMNIAMGGTSILIVVSVALETARTMESQMMMRHHSGFLK